MILSKKNQKTMKQSELQNMLSMLAEKKNVFRANIWDFWTKQIIQKNIYRIDKKKKSFDRFLTV